MSSNVIIESKDLGGKESALPGPLGALGIDVRAPKWRPSSFLLWKGPHRRRKGCLCKSPVEMEFSSLHALGEMPRSAYHCRFPAQLPVSLAITFLWPLPCLPSGSFLLALSLQTWKVGLRERWALGSLFPLLCSNLELTQKCHLTLGLWSGKALCTTLLSVATHKGHLCQTQKCNSQQTHSFLYPCSFLLSSSIPGGH